MLPETNTNKEGSFNVNDHISTFLKEAENPPGQDECMRSFYLALADLALFDPQTNIFIRDITRQRKLTPQHFTNLIFRAVQFIELFSKKNNSYPSSYTDPSVWKKEIAELLKDHKELITEILLTKDTTTTIYQRYAGVKVSLNAIFPNQRLTIADFGCGANYGLPGLSKQLSFKPVADETPNQIFTQFLEKPLHLEKGLAIDKIDPQDPKQKAWCAACSFYPKELNQIPELEVFERNIADVNSVRFLKADLLNLTVNHENGTLPFRHFDAIILSTICYQLDPQQQEKIFETAKKSLKQNGIIIVQDFAKKDPFGRYLNFVRNWFAGDFPYRTFVNGELTGRDFKEFLQWSDGRCTRVRKGEDFYELTKERG